MNALTPTTAAVIDGLTKDISRFLAEDRRCLRCGCHEGLRCVAGCNWVTDHIDICSECVPLELVPAFDDLRKLDDSIENLSQVLDARVTALKEEVLR